MSNKKPTVVINRGCERLPEDERDFDLGALFKQIDINEVPTIDFEIAKPLKIKNQYESDMCTAYAITAISEDQERIELSPEYTFSRTKKIRDEYTKWGADLRTTCKSAVKMGFLPQEESPFVYPDVSRDKIANWLNWPENLSKKAQKHRKLSYFRVNGRYDAFDNIRVAMHQFREEKRTILVGATWRQSWTDAPKGVIPRGYEQNGFGHAFKIFGQKLINGEIYLKAQLSNTIDIGDDGIFYFSRETVNKEFTYGVYMFKDIAPEEVLSLQESDLKVTDTWYKKLWKKFLNLLKLN